MFLNRDYSGTVIDTGRTQRGWLFLNERSIFEELEKIDNDEAEQPPAKKARTDSTPVVAPPNEANFINASRTRGAEDSISTTPTLPGFPPELYNIPKRRHICQHCGWSQKSPCLRHNHVNGHMDLCVQCAQVNSLREVLMTPGVSKEHRAQINILLDHTMRLVQLMGYWDTEDPTYHRQAIELYCSSCDEDAEEEGPHEDMEEENAEEDAKSVLT